MHSEVKNCQNCKQDFIVEFEDFLFYEKIQVPPPTFCPLCRMIRRMGWRNVRSFNKRECGLCNKVLISMYSEKETPVYCTECWNGDNWDQYATGASYDFAVPFFNQWFDLLKKAPRLFRYSSGTLINSDYTNYSADNKNVYLSYSVLTCEEVMYSEMIDYSKKCLDCYAVQKLDNCFNNIDCDGNYNTHYAIKSRNCLDSFFIYDCVNCQDCFLSSNLRNQKYVYKNKQYSKEEYKKIISNINLGSYQVVSELNEIFDDIIKNDTIHRFAQIYNSKDSIGDYISNSNNVKKSFNVHDSENIKYSNRVLLNTKDGFDMQGVGSGELIYEAVASSFNSYKNYFCYITLGSSECEYCFLVKNSKNCFACFGLTNASYCIFNKQYSEEEYFELVDKIKKHMNEMPFVDKNNRVYRYGEFFPLGMSPFGYNETNAIDYFPITKEEALSKKYNWKERDDRNYSITIKGEDLPDDIANVSNLICDEVISCCNQKNIDSQCTMAFKITKEELDFYKQKNIPLPRYCPNCRHYSRLKYINPMKTWERNCMNEGCINTFETTYSPDRVEKVFCKDCYQKEVS